MSALPVPCPECLPVPLLENGARLSQTEFHIRYAGCPDHVRAELIQGTVYMSSPLTIPHSDYDEESGFAFGVYRRATPGVQLLRNATVILGKVNEPQPDLILRVLKEFGGRSRVNKDKYLVGAAELFAEIAYSSRSIDLFEKKDA